MAKSSTELFEYKQALADGAGAELWRHVGSLSCDALWRRCAEQGWTGRDLYQMQPGDPIFFGTAEDLHHVGLVQALQGGVRTVEGNSGDEVRRRSYDMADARIFGWARPVP